MTTLNVNTGVVRYNINEQCTVEYNPTDPGFAARLFTAFEELGDKQAEFRRQLEELTQPRDILALSATWDREIREIVNSVFQKDVCAALFGDMNTYAHADGVPVWCNLLLAIIDTIDEGAAAQQKAGNKKLEKYLDKYTKKNSGK